MSCTRSLRFSNRSELPHCCLSCEFSSSGVKALHLGDFPNVLGVPVAGLLTDLGARGLLDFTLVIWGGEFGRMSISQKKKDEIGCEAVEN